ncbi:trans-2,3-dihydro-3-hydroxyanthranilate isomerase [Rhodoblastus acidophilus]|uniref:Trans-2,3-dihydro-3-hydroxyanthranilate isomerase n=1 Tax=Rhodoblastus acidophilus TaxID=1074 RepID=A0A212RKG0_RHOAC|nr:PhzF family phenazine biosynthesis protein [Rhodoblastus acidophilus]PPQ35993.1 PhzF family phenazine biosynthesis protein [Rhodoblastus acidophilus]RAI18312.1 PhzF family phenazine biosynthesis protein [Rhodoblastus acidophilus]SNB72955.1 trans-2,3-dihydro-3-hydroxyanthranilate isomerase [Rhodoblastus acidophilus]
MPLKYRRLDVFSERPLAGRPLAVVLDADGLAPARMQQIAREFNLPETVFLLKPRDPVNTARLRIFTPTVERPFAGAATIGAAALIAFERARDMLGRAPIRVALEEEIGVIVCEVARINGALRAQFVAPHPPEIVDAPVGAVRLAAALGLAPDEIGFDAHHPMLASAGLPFAFVPVANRAALDRAAPDARALAKILPLARPPVSLYTRETDDPAHHVQVRVFGASHAARNGALAEEAASGVAAIAFAAIAQRFERPEDGEHLLCIEQGYAMGRPSLIALTLQIERGALIQVEVGGASVILGEGTLTL